MSEFIALTWKFFVGGLIATFILFFIHEYIVDNLEKEKIAAVNQAKIDTKKDCQSAIQPSQKANDYDYKNIIDNLNACLGKLQQPARCVPVYISRPAECSKTAGGQPTSGFTQSAIDINNIECKSDRDGLNAAKIWAQQCIEAGKCQ